MCEFIALVTPEDANEAALSSLVLQHSLGSGLSRWSSGDTLILNVEPRGRCHCGTSLGSFEPPTHSTVRYREVAHKRKAGWSEARIDRWLKQKSASARRKESDHAQHVSAVRDDDRVDGWVPFVHQALTSGMTRELGLVVTWGEYSGLPDGDQVIRLADLTPTTLLTMRTNVVYRFIN